MASPVTTSGFQAQNMPNVQLADPRLMVANYGNILPSFGQGFSLAEDVTMAPMRRSLAGIQLQEAQNRLAMAPVEQQLAALRLGEAQQQAAIPQFVAQGTDIVGGDVQLRPVDANASFENFKIVEDYTPRQKVTRGLEVLPGGGIREVERRDTLATAADVRADAQKQAAAIKSTEALAAQRSRGKQFESTALTELYTNAVEEGDTEAAALYKARLDRLNRAPGFLPEGTAYQRRIETIAADAGITLEAAGKLAKTPEGAEAMGVLARRNKAIAADPLNAAFVPNLTPEQKALIDNASRPSVSSAGQPQVSVEDIFDKEKTTGNPKSVPSFNTVEEAEAAAAAQGWRGPVKITIGGRPATWQ